MDHGRPGSNDMACSRERLGRGRVVVRTDFVSDRARVFDCMEIGKQKGHSATAPGTVILRLWSSLMRISLHEFLPMTISTPSANSCGGINRVCAVFCANSLARTWLWQMTLRRKLFSAPTKTSAAFAVKRGFPHGFIESPTIAFARTRAVARNWLAWKSNNGRQSRTRQLSIPV